MSGDHHDLIVVGGGLIGAAAALAAARCGRRVLLLERKAPVLNRGVFDMDVRNVAVSPASAELLRDLGVFGDLHAAPISQMSVWEEEGTGCLDFTAAEVDREELGWILENSPTVLALWSALEREPAVDIHLGAELQALETHEKAIEVHTDAGVFPGRLVVGVDGAHSTVRDLVSTGLATYPTGHHALATLIRTEKTHDNIARQRFLLGGPLALLPSRDPHVVSVVWSQSEGEANRRAQLPDAGFCEEIGVAGEHQLGEVREVAERFVFPLQQQVVENFNPWQRVLLIGDAARVLHPLAGLGANVGFEDVRDLQARLRELAGVSDPGAAGSWTGFARQRRARARLMLSLMSSLRQIYAQDAPLVAWLRNAGVRLTGRLGPLKRQLIREALGLGPLAARW